MNYDFNPYTIKHYQLKCHQAMEGNWETMTDEELIQRCDSWGENVQLQ